MMASVSSWGMTSTTSSRSISTSALRTLRSRGTRSRSSNGRVSGSGGSGFGHGGASTVLLDKFVKHTCMDGSLIVRSPFSVKVRGSFFDPKTNAVDKDRNRKTTEEQAAANDDDDYEGKHSPNSTAMQRELPAILERAISKGAHLGNSDREKLGKLADSIASEYEKGLANMIYGDSEYDFDGLSEVNQMCPLHLLLYGRNFHRVDSYSVVTSSGSNQSSHVYITDASSFEEAEAMFQHYAAAGANEAGQANNGSFEPNGSVSIWQPRTGNAATAEFNSDASSAGLEDEDLVSGFKIYVPQHVLDAPDHGIKGVFLVPTILNRLFLQCVRDGNIELDGQLITDLTSVGLYTEAGNIRLRDVSASEIKTATRFGDILSEGKLDGRVVAETFGEGDFVARHVDGPSITVTTDSGNINVWGECIADCSQFFTRCGHIHVRNLYNQGYLVVREAGNVTCNIVEGSITSVVKKGSVFLTVKTLSSDSTVQVSEGEITLTVPAKPAFRIIASASTTDIAPRLLNSGEIFLSDKTGHETFTSGSHPSTSENELPTLNLVVNNGRINILVAGSSTSTGSVSSNAGASLDFVH